MKNETTPSTNQEQSSNPSGELLETLRTSWKKGFEDRKVELEDLLVEGGDLDTLAEKHSDVKEHLDKIRAVKLGHLHAVKEALSVFNNESKTDEPQNLNVVFSHADAPSTPADTKNISDEKGFSEAEFYADYTTATDKKAATATHEDKNSNKTDDSAKQASNTSEKPSTTADFDDDELSGWEKLKAFNPEAHGIGKVADNTTERASTANGTEKVTELQAAEAVNLTNQLAEALANAPIAAGNSPAQPASSEAPSPLPAPSSEQNSQPEVDSGEEEASSDRKHRLRKLLDKLSWGDLKHAVAQRKFNISQKIFEKRCAWDIKNERRKEKRQKIKNLRENKNLRNGNFLPKDNSRIKPRRLGALLRKMKMPKNNRKSGQKPSESSEEVSFDHDSHDTHSDGDSGE